MGSSIGVGFMAVFAVSGSMAWVAIQVHKRLLSHFMKKVESALGGSERYIPRKKVRFADDVLEPSSNNKEYRRRRTSSVARTNQALTMADVPNRSQHRGELEAAMGINRRCSL